MAEKTYSVCSDRNQNDMNTQNKTQLIEATIATAAVIGLAAVVIPSVGVMTAVVVVAAGLAGMAVLETKKRAY